MSIDIIARALAAKTGVDANASGLFSGVDPVNSIISVTSFDLHIEKDSVGSSMLYIK